MYKKIGFSSLVLLIIATIDSIRNLPSSALFGSSVIFFFLFATVLFLIPTALVAAELSALFPKKGGIYHWVGEAFGEKMAMVALWLQWANTMVWYPSILLFIAGSIAYFLDPTLLHSPGYIISIVLALFWGVTGVNLLGIRISAKVNEILGVLGTMLPMVLLIVLGIVWVWQGHPMQISFHPSELLPSFSNLSTWVSLVSIMAGFLGMELSGVHIHDIENPQRNFPKAIGIASSFIVFSLLFGSLAIAMVVPHGEIDLIAGIMQVFTSFFAALHMEWCVPVIAILVVLGSIGTLINWLLAPAKGFLQATEVGFVPRFFEGTNRFGAPHRILITQAICVTLFCTIFFLIPDCNSFYWFLTALSTGLYMMMYVGMFCAAIRLHYTHRDRATVFKIPGKRVGMWGVGLLGIMGCITTIVVGFFPPDTISVVSVHTYALMIATGNIVMLSPLALFFLYKRTTRHKMEAIL